MISSQRKLCPYCKDFTPKEEKKNMFFRYDVLKIWGKKKEEKVEL